tara:strand:+ start:218 stop:751 length:534 start_codon:yes stop_codon:yes gene_type:complete
MKHRTVYEFRMTDYETDNDGIEKEMITVSHSADMSDGDMTDLLFHIEEFIRHSGYDWVDRYSLNIEGYEREKVTDTDFEEFKEFLKSASEKIEKEKVKQKYDPEELQERLMGIDRTAKIVSLPFPKKQMIDNKEEIKRIENKLDLTYSFGDDGFPSDIDLSQFEFNFDTTDQTKKDT